MIFFFTTTIYRLFVFPNLLTAIYLFWLLFLCLCVFACWQALEEKLFSLSLARARFSLALMRWKLERGTVFSCKQKTSGLFMSIGSFLFLLFFFFFFFVVSSYGLNRFCCDFIIFYASFHLIITIANKKRNNNFTFIVLDRIKLGVLIWWIFCVLEIFICDKTFKLFVSDEFSLFLFILFYFSRSNLELLNLTTLVKFFDIIIIIIIAQN